MEKPKQTNKTFLIILVWMAILFLLTTFASKAMRVWSERNYNLDQQKSLLALQAEKAKYEEILNDRNSPSYIYNKAKDDLNYSFPGEKIYFIKDNSQNGKLIDLNSTITIPEQPKPEVSNIVKWLNLLKN